MGRNLWPSKGSLPEFLRRLVIEKLFSRLSRKLPVPLKSYWTQSTKSPLTFPAHLANKPLIRKKREFVKYSKRFSNTLKEFFRDGQPGPVFTSATYLIYQTNQVMITVKDKCE